MIVSESKNNSSIENSNGKQFSIANNSRSFKILSDGIYSDKITAIIRELSCNAYDSHVAANKKQVAFDVHLPNASEPYFSVTDYGTGLCDSDIYNVYTSYFTSTKTNSNDYVGQLGLGSKSPFCYTNEFFVYSRYGGKERKYRLYYDVYDIPAIEFISESLCTTTGVTIKFDVKWQDHDNFAYKAQDVFRWFDNPPNFSGQLITIDKPTVGVQGRGWSLMNSSENRGTSVNLVMARMGNVAYPINYTSMNLTVEQIGYFWSTPIVIDFNIGDLEVSASRESLSYDTRTINNIKTRLNNILVEFNEIVQGMFSKQSTEYEARNLYFELFGKGSHHKRTQLLTSPIKFNDTVIDSAYKYLDLMKLSLDLKLYTPDKKRAARCFDSFLKISCSGNTIFILDDVIKNTTNIVQYYMNNNKYENYYVVKSNGLSLDTIKADLGYHPIIKMSELDVPAIAAKPVVPKNTHYRLNWYNSDIFNRSPTAINTLVGYYAELVGKNVKLPNCRLVNLSTFYNILSNVTYDNNFVNRQTPLYGSINDKSLNEMKMNPALLDLGLIIYKEVLDTLNQTDFHDQYLKVIIWKNLLNKSNLLPSYYGEFSKFDFKFTDEDSIFKRLCDIDKELNDIFKTQKFKKYERCMSVSSYFKDIVSNSANEYTTKYSLLLAEAKKRYELLPIIPTSQWGNNFRSINNYINLVDITYYQVELSKEIPFQPDIEPIW